MAESLPRKLHRWADALDGRIGPSLRRAPPLQRTWIGILDAIVARQPDRAYLRKRILPAVVQSQPARILFVGVRGYTRAYGGVFQGGRTEFWTSDIDPAAAQYGAPERHVLADVRELDAVFATGFFDLIIMNGVFGWGVDDPAGMDRALRAAERVLRSGGALLLGWNSDRCPDPATLPAAALFAPTQFADLPQRKTFADVTHVYAWYRRRE